MSRRALSASRASDLLNFLAAHPGRAYTYSELARDLQINLASTHSLLVALCESGFLVRDPVDRSFGLGPALVAIGDAALQRNPVIDEARPRMRAMSRALELEPLAFVQAGADTLCVARAGPDQPPGMTARVGQRVPLMAPLAPVFVAWAPPEEVEAWLLRGGASRKERRQREAHLALVRQRGYSGAVEVEGRRRIGDLLSELADDPHSKSLRDQLRDQIHELGHGEFRLSGTARRSYPIYGITAPVFDERGRVALSITLQGYPRNLSLRALDDYARRLQELTREIGDAARARR